MEGTKIKIVYKTLPHNKFVNKTEAAISHCNFLFKCHKLFQLEEGHNNQIQKMNLIIKINNNIKNLYYLIWQKLEPS